MWSYRIEDADAERVYLPVGLFVTDFRNGHRYGLPPVPVLTQMSCVAAGTVYIVMDEHGKDWCWLPVRDADADIIRKFCCMKREQARNRALVAQFARAA